MALAQSYRSQVGPFRGDRRSSFNRQHRPLINYMVPINNNSYVVPDNFFPNYENSYEFSKNIWEPNYYSKVVEADVVPPVKRRKFSASAWESGMRSYVQPPMYEHGPSTNKNSSVPTVRTDSVRADAYQPPSCKRDLSVFEDEELVFMSRDEIERCSPSRKDGIDALQETRLRYSYCSFLQNLGIRLEM